MVSALPVPVKDEIVSAVRRFQNFATTFDLMGKHDCGHLVVQGHEIVGKIIYYRRDRDKFLAADPADPAITKRVMTLMSMEEYCYVAI